MPDYSYRDAIAKYERDVRDGTITFGPDGYADSYPGKDESERALMEHAARHTTGIVPTDKTPALWERDERL